MVTRGGHRRGTRRAVRRLWWVERRPEVACCVHRHPVGRDAAGGTVRVYGRGRDGWDRAEHPGRWDDTHEYGDVVTHPADVVIHHRSVDGSRTDNGDHDAERQCDLDHVPGFGTRRGGVSDGGSGEHQHPGDRG